MERGPQAEVLDDTPVDLFEAFADQEITIFGKTGTFRELGKLCPEDLDGPTMSVEKKNNFVAKVANEAGVAIDKKYEQQFIKILEKNNIERKFTIAESKPQQQVERQPAERPQLTGKKVGGSGRETVQSEYSTNWPRLHLAESAASTVRPAENDSEARSVSERSARRAVAEAFARQEVVIGEVRALSAIKTLDVVQPDINVAVNPERLLAIAKPGRSSHLRLIISPSFETVGATVPPELVIVPSSVIESTAQETSTDVGEDGTPTVYAVEAEPDDIVDAFGATPTDDESSGKVIDGAADMTEVTDIETLLLPKIEQPIEVHTFSMQIETLVRQTVELQRQTEVRAMLERMYDIVDGKDKAAMSQIEERESEEVFEVLELTMNEELQAITAKVLQELGVAEPTPKQIEQFIGRIWAEKVVQAKPDDATFAEPAVQEDPHGFAASVWRRYRQFMHLHQPLAKLALALPEAA